MFLVLFRLMALVSSQWWILRAKLLVLYPDAIELHIRRVYDTQSVLFAEDSEIILGLWSEGEKLVGVHMGKEMVW